MYRNIPENILNIAHQKLQLRYLLPKEIGSAKKPVNILSFI
jgi:hypothetical protein